MACVSTVITLVAAEEWYDSMCQERTFFFSSRRRHTRLQGDWSSDECSSDLGGSRGNSMFRRIGWTPRHRDDRRDSRIEVAWMRSIVSVLGIPGSDGGVRNRGCHECKSPRLKWSRKTRIHHRLLGQLHPPVAGRTCVPEMDCGKGRLVPLRNAFPHPS